MRSDIDYSRFFELCTDLLCVSSSSGWFELVNSNFTRKLGWSEVELLERPFVDFVHPEDVEATAAELEQLNQGLPSIHFQNRYLHKDGGWRTLTWTAFLEKHTGRIYAAARVS